MNRKVVIVQDYVPEYRSPFFEALSTLAESSDFEVQIVTGAPDPQLRTRSDKSTHAVIQVKQHELRMMGRRVVFRRLRNALADADLVVIEQARRNLDIYRLLLPRRKQQFALWGHGRDYVKRPGRLSRAIMDLLARRADHIFVYTNGGASHLRSLGIPARKLTVVQNSSDTSGLRSMMQSITMTELQAYQQAFNLSGCTALYIGGLDRSKSIDLLISSAKAAHELDRRFVLLIGGDGEQRGLVEKEAEATPFIHYLGRLDGRCKALALSAADVIANPGRVGLIAVDSIASARPIITFRDVDHAPEYEYLSSANSITVDTTNSDLYARSMVGILTNPALLSSMQVSLTGQYDNFGTTEMAKRFSAGLTQALSASGRS